MDPETPPLLRGWLHLVCFFLALPAGFVVVRAAETTRGRTGAVIYAVGLAALFGVSAAYHRGHWSLPARARMRRADHATIFLMIAASYTPICLVALPGRGGITLLVAAWAGALGGFVLAVLGIAERKGVGLACYITLGWVAALAFPGLTRHLTGGQMALLVAGGVIYTVGGIVLGSRHPDPFPRVFGYHEVWHTMVVVAAVCHFILIISLVGAAGT
ncbi:MAG TPA: hemolysin III family protein [Acidimicrobiales bacterium]|nr:hemolysin III family protein [Acidimicrobiales bacterium]